MQTVRTTIRIRKDLLDKSRHLALEKGISLQQVMNDALTVGFNKITDISSRRKAMAEIEKFRKNLEKRGKKINVMKLVEQNKKELQERTDRILSGFKNG